jgi:hypothetical protein
MWFPCPPRRNPFRIYQSLFGGPSDYPEPLLLYPPAEEIGGDTEQKRQGFPVYRRKLNGLVYSLSRSYTWSFVKSSGSPLFIPSPPPLEIGGRR